MKINAFFLFFKKLEIKWAVKTGFAAGLAFLLGVWLSFVLHDSQTSKWISGLWSTVSAIIVSKPLLGSSFRFATIRFIGSGIGSALGATFTVLLGATFFSLSISVAIAVMVMSLINLRSSIALTGATLAVVMILWKVSPESGPWMFALQRFLDACIGTIVAITVSLVFWPERAQKKMHLNMSEIVFSIYELFQVNKAGALKRAKSLIEEIEKKFEANLLFLKEARLEMLMVKPKAQNWMHLHRKLYRLYDYVICLNAIERKEFQHIETLAVFLSDVQEKIELSLQESSFALQRGKTVHIHEDLADALDKLEKMIQANEKKEIKLGHAKDLFFYLYLLREISNEIIEIARTIVRINRKEKAEEASGEN